MGTATSDTDILEAVRKGEDRAFDLFVGKYGRRLLAFGIRMCGHRQDGEDVFQETLIKAYQGLAKVESPKALKTWLFRVASNHCLMRRRPGSRAASRELPMDDVRGKESNVIEWGGDSEPEIADWSQLPEEILRRGELRAALERATLDLPSDQRVVFVLRDVEGLSTKETAAVLEIKESAVKMRLHRARMTLRGKLSHFLGAIGAAGEGMSTHERH